MDKYTIHFFGGLCLIRGNQSLGLPISSVARSLLAYLLYHRHQHQSRLKLIGLFWPDYPEGRARRALSQALWHIRHAFPGLVISDAGELYVPEDVVAWEDVEAFQSLLANPESGVQELQEAVGLYQGDLLEGYYDEWILPIREQLREKCCHALEKIIGIHKTAGRYHEALEFALQLCRVDPLREWAHQEAMSLFYLMNRPQAALQQYARYLDLLRSEEQGGWTDLEAASEIHTLAQEIARRSGLESPSYLPRSHLPEPSLLREAMSFETKLAPYLPLIGRKEERQQLLSLLETIFDESEPVGGILLLEGEAGIGKTRLLQEISRDLAWRGGEVLWGYSNQIGIAQPYAPLVDALGEGLSNLRLNQLARMLQPIWLQVLASYLPAIPLHLPFVEAAPPLKPDQEIVRLREAFLQLLLAWGDCTPLTIILEDLQWADHDTLDLLGFLATQQRFENSSVMIIGVYRSDEARTFPALWEKIEAMDRAGLRGRITLFALDQKSCGELIRYSLGLRQAVPLFESRLFQETEGNPLFILETLRFLYDEGLLQWDETGEWRTPWDESTADYTELPLPPVVEEVIQRRIARLTRSMQTILQNAAVVAGISPANEFEFSLFVSVCDLKTTELLNSMKGLARRHFLQETSLGYRFTHGKICQVVYQMISPQARIDLHQKTASIIEHEFPEKAHILAYHFAQGCVWDKAVKAALAQAKTAASQYLVEAALTAFRQARQWLEEHQPFSEAKRCELAFEIWEASYPLEKARGNADACQLATQEMLELADRLQMPEFRVRALLQRTQYLHDIVSQEEEAQAIAIKALKITQEGQLLELEAQAWLVLGAIQKEQVQNQEAKTSLLRALEIYRAQNMGQQEADVVLRLSFVHRDLGDISQARSYAEQALALYLAQEDQLNLALTYNALAWVARSQGDHSEEARYCQRMYEIMHAIGYIYYEGVALTNLSLAYGALSDYEQAISAGERALAVFKRLNHPRGQTINLLNLSSRYKETGRFTLAEESLDAGLNLAQEMKFADEEARMHLSYAELLTWREAYHEAQEHLTRAEQLASQLRYPYLEANVAYRTGELHLALGDIPQALRCFQQARQSYRQAGWEEFVHLMGSFEALCQMKLGNLPEAVRLSNEVLSGMEGGELHMNFHHYLILKTEGQIQGARETLKQAWESLQKRISAAPDEPCQKNLEAGVPVHREILAAWQTEGARQVVVRLARQEAPTGRPLRPEEWVQVTLTVADPGDDRISNKAARRQARLQRILVEARDQGGIPTVADLAGVLGVSDRTIKRDLVELRQAGITLDTRGSL